MSNVKEVSNNIKNDIKNGNKNIKLKRLIKANDKHYQELAHELEEEKLYLNRLYQQGKNEHVKMTSNIIEFNDEVETTQNIIKNKEKLLDTYLNKTPLKRGLFR